MDKSIVKIGDLEKKYKKIPYPKLEEMAGAAKEQSIKHYTEFLSIMVHFQKTNRFREDPQFKNTSFEDYLMLKHGMRFSEYTKRRIAYIIFPEETKALGGPGFINRAVNKCGALKVPEIVKEVKAIESTGKVVTTESFDKIIDKHAKPLIDVTPKERSIRELQSELDRVWSLLESQRKENQQLREQNKKLKEAVKKYKSNLN
jgi:hypothetical protein